MRQRTINITLASDTSSANNGHIQPVNSLASYQSTLFSGGRDGVIVQYNKDSQIINKSESHSDWVNDIVVFGDKLVSASSDLSVQVWDPERHTHGIIGHHHDYVKVLANHNNQYVVSGGLDKYVNFWDLYKDAVVMSYHNLLEGDLGSIYSMDSNLRMVAFGDNDHNIMLFDPKSDKIVNKFNEHTDMVKSIKLSENYLLSGSSDHTIKIFDLRTNKVMKSYSFDNSVWSLSSNSQDFSEIIAGDSSGSIYKIDQDITTVIGKEKRGILSIIEFNNELWTSSMDNSNVTNWTTNSKTIVNKSQGIIRKRMLNNRRNVVTLNESNEVIIWDIVKCCEQKKFLNKTFEEVCEEYQTLEVLPSWCNISIKAGKLVLTVKDSNFTNTEIYGDELMSCYEEIEGIDNDFRYNLGKIFFMSIFQNYLKYLFGKDLDYRTEKIKYLEEFKSRNENNSSSDNKVNEDIKEKDSKKFKLFGRRSSNVSKQSLPSPFDPETSTSNFIPSAIAEANEDIVISLESVLKEIHKVYDTTYTIQSLRTSLISPPSITEVPRLSISNNIILNIKEKLTTQDQNDEIDIFNDHLTEDNYEILQKLLPKWVGSFILNNQLKPQGSFSKIGFMILRNKEETYLPDINSHLEQTSTDKSTPEPETPTNELTNLNLNPPKLNNHINSRSSSSSSANHTLPTPPTTSGTTTAASTTNTSSTTATTFELGLRLNAYNMLRIKKIKSYIYDKFPEDFRLSESKDFENWIELLCNDEVVDNSTTLATLRTFIWKSSGDILLKYRMKKKLSNELTE